MAGTCRFGVSALSMTSGRGRFAGFELFEIGKLGNGAPVDCLVSDRPPIRGSSGDSSNVPHIPQKRKLSELSSPHFGQITMILRMPVL
jgi:hypothetical protein